MHNTAELQARLSLNLTLFFIMLRLPPISTLFPYTTLFRSRGGGPGRRHQRRRPGLPLLGHLRPRSEEHTSELQSRQYLVCRLLLEKKKNNNQSTMHEWSEATHEILIQLIANKYYITSEQSK